MIKIEKVFEVNSVQKVTDGYWTAPAQFTHLNPVDKPHLNLPQINSFMLILPLGLTTVGKKFKVTVEEIG